MPIEKRPSNPINKNFIPPNCKKYKVMDGDSWNLIAARNNMDAWDLIRFNFKTSIPEEVNWYLKHYVGCKKKTKDGYNWMFSSAASPGFIYIPIRTIYFPPRVIYGVRPHSKYRKLWAGLGKAHSGDFFVIGAHDLTAKIYNLGDFDETSKVKNVAININGWKFGLGLGGSIGAVFVIAHGYENGREMNGVSGGWDFDIALISKLSDFLKGVRGLGKAVDTYEKYKKLRYLTENAIKNLGITKPGVYTIPIPFGGWGAHIWGGYKFGDVNVFYSGRGIP